MELQETKIPDLFLKQIGYFNFVIIVIIFYVETHCSASLQRASLQRASLQRASLQRASLQRASLQRASLQRASLQRASLQ
ncbi:hypothetical protein E0F89_07115 [Flavobacterium caseinilyticum]|uniref:Uncharacterized protein n=1 Tax=Flavobacterium caseinilyticum TaxID=2541732 RepID=A0A4R5AYV2_9FLAO|nr:hypothetical protein E0F89_07115 [Flavobacterium caseinilyticum]